MDDDDDTTAGEGGVSGAGVVVGGSGGGGGGEGVVAKVVATSSGCLFASGKEDEVDGFGELVDGKRAELGRESYTGKKILDPKLKSLKEELMLACGW